MDPSEEKARMRESVRAARKAITAEQRREAAVAIAQQALSLPEVAQAHSVLGYCALPEEADPAPLVRALRAHGARIALPRVVEPGVLSLHWVGESDELVCSRFGIFEPAEGSPTASPSELDLVIVPGVAFDPGCGRLGFGGGFYDSLLPMLGPSASTVAIAFDEQMVEAVPRGQRDARVDAVVTPTKVLRREG